MSFRRGPLALKVNSLLLSSPALTTIFPWVLLVGDQPAEDIPHIAPPHSINPKAVTAFLQATTDTFWAVEKAINEYRAMEHSLRKARKDTSIIIRSIRDAFPDSKESIELLGCAGLGG